MQVQHQIWLVGDTQHRSSCTHTLQLVSLYPGLDWVHVHWPLALQCTMDKTHARVDCNDFFIDLLWFISVHVYGLVFPYMFHYTDKVAQYVDNWTLDKFWTLIQFKTHIIYHPCTFDSSLSLTTKSYCLHWYMICWSSRAFTEIGAYQILFFKTLPLCFFTLICFTHLF